MELAQTLSRVAAELALFAGVGFLLFAVNDLVVDLIYFGRAIWRSLMVYSRYPRAFASTLPASAQPGFIAVLIPAWDEASVIASMLHATLRRIDYPNYRLFVGHYRNDPATSAAIASVCDERIEAVEVDANGPTTKADCLNHLYDALIAHENATGRSARAIVLHDAEDVVHPLELGIFDRAHRPCGGDPAAGASAGRPQLALDRRPLLRRVRGGAHQGAGRARGRRRRGPARRRQLRD